MADAHAHPRLVAAGIDLPGALLDLIAPSVGPMLAGLDDLARVDLGVIEPFDPARRLADDTTR